MLREELKRRASRLSIEDDPYGEGLNFAGLNQAEIRELLDECPDSNEQNSMSE
jgi:hypothetical protein